MEENHKLWKAHYNYISKASGYKTPMLLEYFVIAKSEKEALAKCDVFFSTSDLHKELLLKGRGKSSDGRLELCHLNRFAGEYKENVKLPYLFKADDEEFELEPVITNENTTLEFIVKKKV